MDLGATICTPRRPACALCPWLAPCRARDAGTQETYPRKIKGTKGALRRGAAFVVVRSGDEAILLRTRPPEGLLGNMAEPPTSAWEPDYDPAAALLDAPLDARWKRLPGLVRHGFTHFPLELTVFLARVGLSTQPPPGLRFTPRRDLAEEPLPGLMRKVLAHAFDPKPEPAAKPRGRPRKDPPPMPLLAVFDPPETVAEPEPRLRFRPVPKPAPRVIERAPETDESFEGEPVAEAPAARKPAPRKPARRTR